MMVSDKRRRVFGMMLACSDFGLSFERLDNVRSDAFEDGTVRIHLSDQPQSLKGRREEMSQRVEIGDMRELTGRAGPAERLAESGFDRLQTLADPIQSGLVASRQFSGAIAEEAAAPSMA